MKIYTKTGDQGQTGLMGGKRVSKNSPRIKAIGQVDELNAALGLVRAHIDSFNASPANLQSQNPAKEWAKVSKILRQIQHDLFSLGADLATPSDFPSPSSISSVANHAPHPQIPRIHPAQIKQLENWIDELDTKLPPLKNFILPGGSIQAAHLHLARTICRRTERAIISLQTKEKINEQIVPYLNRLSDLLFILARFVNQLQKITEEKWQA
ncbi:MAG: cob(I)yrinic acid a,c-diamide adenosyltransferase [Candidatus Gracilibacteria bacterium]|jgi:cob(I)alamin adenosyltransferase